MNVHFIRIGSLALVLAAMSTVAPAAIITNGDFDSYTSPTDGAAISSLSPASWVGNNSNVQYKTAAGPGNVVVAQSGTGFLAIFGTVTGNNAYQTFSTLATGSYTLTFFLTRQNTNTPTVTVDVFDGTNQAVTPLSTGAFSPSGAAGNWTQKTLNFTAASATTTIRFKDTGSTSSVDLFIDNVVVTGPSPVTVPTPAALPAGLALAGALMMRRRK
ncbi:MAG: DUF642 domain-containing protein [Planctomycetes bacterium]|nr:DUF642 domain-containing protein [Planctomycetota bacterium]